jgi:hypothetical protein
VPTRYVQNSLWDGFAYAAVAFKDGPGAARLSAFRLFVERHYGAEWNALWDEAFALIYDATPGYGGGSSISPLALHLHTPWASDARLKEALKSASGANDAFTRARALLVRLEPMVVKNVSDFQAFALSVECMERCFWRDAAVARHAAQKAQDSGAASLLIQAIAAGDRELVERLTRDWDQGRSPESAGKRELITGLQAKDQLLYQWQQAAAYSAGLAAHPDRVGALLQR